MTSLNQTIKDIKELKIQGAEAVARGAAKALGDFSSMLKVDKEHQFIHELDKAASHLAATRPTEPAMKNTLHFMTNDLKHKNFSSLNEIREYIEAKKNYVLEHFDVSSKRIAEFGSRKIRRGSIVYTHCHSSSVVKVFKEAKRKGITFEVHNTETRPRFQGRITAAELASVGIKVVHYVDSGAAYALKKADMMLIGADAITSEGMVANKIGSAVFAEIAYDEQIPVYCCANSWKFDANTAKGFLEQIEERDPKEVWEKPPRSVIIRNPAFDMIDSKYITGIISELGVYKPDVFVEEVKMKYPWMFE